MRKIVRSRDHIVLTREHLAEVVDYFLKQEAFVFDIESMGPDRVVPTQNDVVWIALATEGMAVVIPFGHPNGNTLLRAATRRKNKLTGKFDPIPPVFTPPPDQLRRGEVFAALEPLFFNEGIVKIAHNATFDLISVAKYYSGRIPTGPKHDTIVIQHLLNENLLSKGLKDLTIKYYGVKYDHENVGRDITLHPFGKVAHYALMDARYTWLLWKRLLPLIEEHDLLQVFELELNDGNTGVIDVISEMGKIGAPVDVETLESLRDDLSARLVDIEGRIYKAAGRKFNINSTPQKQEILYGSKDKGGQGLRITKRTDKGAPSTDADTLEQHKGNALVDAMLDYAEINKLLGTYVLGYLGEEGNPKKPCRIYDGRIHADLVQYGTVTGRFSCREPNLQNIPRPGTDLGKKIRGLFIAPPGMKMVVADYGQIEMMLLAHFAGPGPLYNGIHNGMDPHSATAAALAGIDTEEFMRMVAADDPRAKAARQVAKGINFAVVYGAGPDKVAAMAGITVKEAKKFLNIHQQQFPEIYRFKKKVIEVCKSRRPPHVVTILGRKRRLPAIFSGDQGTRGYAERQAVNSLIQGSAADIIKLAMIRLHDSLPDDMNLILSVHDELVTLCPEEKAEECAALVHEAMLGQGIQKLVNVPLTSDVKIVDRWSEAK